MSFQSQQNQSRNYGTNALQQSKNQDQLPNMFSYANNDQILIENALKDVQEFINKIRGLGEKEQAQHLTKFDQMSNQCTQDLKELITWMDIMIDNVFLKYPAYTEKLNKQSRVHIELKFSENITLEWVNERQDQELNEDFWQKDVYIQYIIGACICTDEFFQNPYKLSDTQRQINYYVHNYLTESLQDDEQLYKDLPNKWQKKYQIAKKQTQEVELQLQLLSTKDERNVMLIFAINNIEINFVQTQKEENQALIILEGKFQEALKQKFLGILRKYYNDNYKLVLNITGDLNKSVSSIVNKEFIKSDKIFKKIDQLRVQIEEEQAKCEQQSQKLVDVLNLHPDIKLIEERLGPRQIISFLNQNNRVLSCTQHKHQFSIKTYLIYIKNRVKNQIIFVNFFENPDIRQYNESFSIKVPYSTIDVFLKQNSEESLILTILAAFDLKAEIINFQVIEQIFNEKTQLVEELQDLIFKLDKIYDPVIDQMKIKNFRKDMKIQKIKDYVEQQPTDLSYQRNVGIIEVNKFQIHMVLSNDEVISVNYKDEQFNQSFKKVTFFNVDPLLFNTFNENKKRLYQTILDAEKLNCKIEMKSLSKIIHLVQQRNQEFIQTNSLTDRLLKENLTVLEKIKEQTLVVQGFMKKNIHLPKNKLQHEVLRTQQQNLDKTIFGLLWTHENHQQFIITKSYSEHSIYVNHRHIEDKNQTYLIDIDSTILKQLKLCVNSFIVQIIYETTFRYQKVNLTTLGQTILAIKEEQAIEFESFLDQLKLIDDPAAEQLQFEGSSEEQSRNYQILINRKDTQAQMNSYQRFIEIIDINQTQLIIIIKSISDNFVISVNYRDEILQQYFHDVIHIDAPVQLFNSFQNNKKRLYQIFLDAEQLQCNIDIASLKSLIKVVQERNKNFNPIHAEERKTSLHQQQKQVNNSQFLTTHEKLQPPKQNKILQFLSFLFQIPQFFKKFVVKQKLKPEKIIQIQPEKWLQIEELQFLVDNNKTWLAKYILEKDLRPKLSAFKVEIQLKRLIDILLNFNNFELQDTLKMTKDEGFLREAIKKIVANQITQ